MASKQWDEMNPKQRIVGIIGLIVVIFIVVTIINATTGNGKSTNGNQPAQQKTDKKSITYTLSAKADATGQDMLYVNGATNLPNGAIFNIDVKRIIVFSDETEKRFYDVADKKTTAKKGNYNAQVKVNDKKLLDFAQSISQGTAGHVITKLDSKVQVTVTFNPKQQGQPQNVVKAVGKSGENLANSPQKSVFGSLTEHPVNQLEVLLKTPLEFPYSSQLPK